MNKIYKSVLAVAATTIVAGATLAPKVVNAWGDSSNGRASYTAAQIESGVLGNTITFNSISDGKIGNEKNFVGAQLSSSTSNVWNANEINVKDGETYTIRLYVHNNNPKGMGAIAENVTATFSLPTTVATSHNVIGYLNSTNSTPARYWDEVKLVSDSDFYIEYVKGSAKYTNAVLGTVALPDDIIISGAKIGYSALDGKIPGCTTYDGVATIEVKVHKSVAAKVATTVRKVTIADDGTISSNGNKFGESVDANLGEYVQYQIEYVNLLDHTVNNVMIRDILPDNLEYVADSTYFYSSTYKNGVRVADNTVTTTGINIGNYNTNANAYVRFVAKVVDKNVTCGYNQLVNWASATVESKVFKDDASVMFNDTRENCRQKDGGNTNKIVNAGATEIAGVALGAGAVTTALGYAIASRKKF